MKCYVIQRKDDRRYFSNMYNWQKQLHKALFYKTQKAAIEMAERKECNYEILSVNIEITD